MRRVERDAREPRDGDSLSVEQRGGSGEALLANAYSEDPSGEPLPTGLTGMSRDRRGWRTKGRFVHLARNERLPRTRWEGENTDPAGVALDKETSRCRVSFPGEEALRLSQSRLGSVKSVQNCRGSDRGAIRQGRAGNSSSAAERAPSGRG
jgi:hypothetical protein